MGIEPTTSSLGTTRDCNDFNELSAKLGLKVSFDIKALDLG
jgi:hypothetical protein